MASHSLRVALLIGVLGAFASSAKADHCSPAPCYRTITCTKWVPEYHTVKKTVNRYERRKVAYDTFKCVRVCECREKTITVHKRVPVYKTVTRNVYESVWDYETRTVQRPHYVNQTYTVMEKKLVRKGHYENRQVETFMSKMKGKFSRGNKCCDPCDPCCKTHCPKYRCKKTWVKCPVYTCCPVTKCKKVCVMKAECCKVKVCRKVCKQVKCKVCTYQCVPCKQTVKCNVWVTKKVACKAYKCVCVCVPCQVDVRCCRMVQRSYTQQVPVADSCRHDCCSSSRHCCPTTCCEQSCCDPCCERPRHRLFGGRNRNKCCESSCNTCCN